MTIISNFESLLKKWECDQRSLFRNKCSEGMSKLYLSYRKEGSQSKLWSSLRACFKSARHWMHLIILKVFLLLIRQELSSLMTFQTEQSSSRYTSIQYKSLLRSIVINNLSPSHDTLGLFVAWSAYLSSLATSINLKLNMRLTINQQVWTTMYILWTFWNNAVVLYVGVARDVRLFVFRLSFNQKHQQRWYTHKPLQYTHKPLQFHKI